MDPSIHSVEVSFCNSGNRTGMAGGPDQPKNCLNRRTDIGDNIGLADVEIAAVDKEKNKVNYSRQQSRILPMTPLSLPMRLPDLS